MILEISFVYKYSVYIFLNCGSGYTALEQNPTRTSRGDGKSTKKAKQRLNALWLGEHVTSCFWVFGIII